MKKSSRIASVLLSLALVLSMMSISAFAAETVSNDTTETFEIRTEADLYELSRRVAEESEVLGNLHVYTCDVILMNDIEMIGDSNGDGKVDSNDTAWTGIGLPQQSYCFSGTFDGNNHTISGISLTNSSTVGPKGGLFNFVTGTTIKNLTIEGSVTSNRFVGGLVGRVVGDLDIINCNVNMKLTLNNGMSNSIGGLIGQCGAGAGLHLEDGSGHPGDTYGIINVIGCSVNGEFTSNTANNPVGGVIGHVYANYIVTMQNTTTAAALTAPTGTATGAYVGNNAGSVGILNCTNLTGVDTLVGVDTGITVVA